MPTLVLHRVRLIINTFTPVFFVHQVPQKSTCMRILIYAITCEQSRVSRLSHTHCHTFWTCVCRMDTRVCPTHAYTQLVLDRRTCTCNLHVGRMLVYPRLCWTDMNVPVTRELCARTLRCTIQCTKYSFLYMCTQLFPAGLKYTPNMTLIVWLKYVFQTLGVKYKSINV